MGVAVGREKKKRGRGIWIGFFWGVLNGLGGGGRMVVDGGLGGRGGK